jgi:hypothetical protein
VDGTRIGGGLFSKYNPEKFSALNADEQVGGAVDVEVYRSAGSAQPEVRVSIRAIRRAGMTG